MTLRPDGYHSIRDAVCKLANGVRTVGEIAALAGTTTDYVRTTATTLALEVPYVHHPRGEWFRRALRETASPERTIREVATTLAVPYSTVQRRMHALTLPYKPATFGRPRKDITHEQDRA
jgi:hypothetical protein